MQQEQSSITINHHKISPMIERFVWVLGGLHLLYFSIKLTDPANLAIRELWLDFIVIFFFVGTVLFLRWSKSKKTVFDLQKKMIYSNSGREIPFSHVKEVVITFENKVMKYGSIQIFYLVLKTNDGTELILTESPNEAQLKELKKTLVLS